MASREIGDRIPAFSLEDSAGRLFTEKDLKGKTTILYFYPKDMTPGCTREACDFQASLLEFTKRGIQVIGVSKDAPVTHQKFQKKYDLQFPLLCDENHELAQLFGVYQQKQLFGIKHMGIVRSTFIINPQLTIIWKEEKVRVRGHVERLLSAIQMLVSP